MGGGGWRIPHLRSRLGGGGVPWPGLDGGGGYPISGPGWGGTPARSGWWWGVPWPGLDGMGVPRVPPWPGLGGGGTPLPPLGWGIPHHPDLAGVPPQPRPEMGDSSYAGGGMPLAFKREDFLVYFYFLFEYCRVLKLFGSDRMLFLVGPW